MLVKVTENIDFTTILNFSSFLSARLRKSKTDSFSATVYRIGVGSIALGLVVMIVAFAVLFGFKNTVREKLFTLTSQLRVTKFSLNQSYEESPLPIQTDLYQHYQKLSEITHIQAVAHKPGILKANTGLQGVILKGVGQDYDWANFSQNILEGQPIQWSDSTYSNQILISKTIAQQLNLHLGDDVVMWFLQQPPRPRKLKVQGIYEPSLEEFNQLIIGDLALIQRLNAWGKDTAGVYEINVKDFERLDQAAAQVESLMRPDMNIEKVTERYRPIFDWLILLDRNMVVFLTLILFVCCFNMTSILLVMMMERTPMIGLFKAFGSTNWQIRKIFLYQGISMIIKGLFWGNLLGVGICWVQQRFKIIPLDPANYFMNTVPIQFDWFVILMLNIGTLVLVTLVLIIPTVVITKVQPVKAIAFNK